MKFLRSRFLFFASCSCVACLVALLATSATAAPGVATGLGTPERSAKTHVFAVHNVGTMGLLVTNYGLIGSQWSAQSSFSDQPSARWPMPNGPEYLWGGGLWVGAVVNGERRVTTGEYMHELRPVETDPLDIIYASAIGAPGGSRYPWPDPDDDHDGLEDEDPLNGRDDDGDGLVDEDFAAISNQYFRCVLSDTTALAQELYPDHTPLGIQVVQQSFEWSDAENDDYVGFEFTIRNIGANLLDQVYVGFFADCDIGPRDHPAAASDDMAGSWSGIRVASDGSPVLVQAAYMYDDNGDGGEAPGYFGVVGLGATDPGGLAVPDSVAVRSSHHFTGSAAYGDGGDPVNDSDRYDALSLRDSDANVPPGQADDYRVLISCGPFASLAPGQAVTYRVALVVGSGLGGMLSSAANAVHTYQGRAFNRDGDPGTGPDGKEYVVHWLRTSDTPVAATHGTLAARVEGAAARVELTAHAIGAGSLVLERRAGDGAAVRRWEQSEFASLARHGDDLSAAVVDDEAVGWPRAYSLLLRDGGQERLLDRIEVSGAIPSALRVDAWPNPFNPRLEVRLALPRSGAVDVSVYDARGRLVQTLLAGDIVAGERTLVWDGRDREGRSAPAGVYLVRAKDQGAQALRRIVLVR